MTGFSPAHLPEDRQLRDRVSQTFLRHANGCMRSGFLYALHKGEAQTVEMVRGSAVHAAIERATNTAIEMGETTCPPEVAKAILDEVLGEFPVPFEEHDFMRESMARWAAGWKVNPDAVVSVERLFVLDMLGYEVRMKIDYAELRDRGRRIYIADYKTGRGAPTQEAVSRKRPDGTLMAKNFQLCLYALGLAFGQPVLDLGEIDGERVERREPPIGRTAVDFDLEFVYPGIQAYDENGEPQMLRRLVSLTRLELEELRGSLATLLGRVRVAEQTGEWPAVVSDMACTECPSQRSCPIPQALRSHRGTINTMDEAREAAELLWWEKKDHRARRAELKAFHKADGRPIRFGKDMVACEEAQTRTTIPKRDDMLLAAQRSAEFGEPFDREDWVKTSTSTVFVDAQLSDDELAAEVAGREQ